MSEVRRCTRCGETKARTEFYTHKHCWCKTCVKENTKQYLNKPGVRRKYLDQTKHKKFGLTRNQILAMLERQDGKCEICRKPITSIDGHGTHIDHDHIRGHVRGILCSHCNLGLGHFKDSIAVLRNAIEYLQLDTPTTPASVQPTQGDNHGC